MNFWVLGNSSFEIDSFGMGLHTLYVTSYDMFLQYMENISSVITNVYNVQLSVLTLLSLH